MTSHSQLRAGGPAASSPWTRPPEQPARYRLPERLSDMIHGWLDGRHGLPPLPPDAGRPGQDTPLPRTSRMEVLARQATELIEGERIRCGEDSAVLKREATQFLMIRDALSDEFAVTERKLREAQNPLSDQQRDARRLAEHDTQHRPAGLVRLRRQTAWDRQLAAAEQRHWGIVARLAEASREAQLREELISDRAAAARAGARRHHELALRRIATYLQQLVRTHPHGAELNRLLVEHPAGPDLPAWTRDPAAGKPGAETLDRYPRNETSRP
ncbi:MAG: hypothetical protein ACRDND_14085 [Streptosporangiaceae bacterium]